MLSSNKLSIPGSRYGSGFTIVELVLVLMIMSIIGAAAIPIYQDYLVNAKISVARTNAESLRLFLEDYYLSNGTYRAASKANHTQSATQSDIADNYGWLPSGDQGLYTYKIRVSGQTWHVVVTHEDGTWIRCQDRMSKCCAIGDPGASTSSCP